MSTSLGSIQGSQLMEIPLMSSPTSPAIPANRTEHFKYYAIYTTLGKICPEEFAVSSDWDEDKKDQAKEKAGLPVVREKSGNFVESQGILGFFGRSGNFVTWYI